MESKKLKTELAFPAVLIILSIYIIINSKSYGDEGTFPSMIGYGLLLSTIALVIKITKFNVFVTNFENINIKKVVFTVLSLLIYYLLYNILGYFISTVLLGIVILYIMQYNNMIKGSLIILLTTIVVFFIFKVLLKVTLPTIII